MGHTSHPRCISIAFTIIVIGLFLNSAPGHAQEHESFEGFVTGIRANAVKGDVVYRREDAKFNLEAGLRLEEGDLIETDTNAYAELLLQPGNYLRIGGGSEFQIINDSHDRMRLKLNRGAISVEIVGRDGEASWTLYESLSQRYELIRVISPGAELFITQPGLFRVNVINASQTDVMVRKGEAVVNGRQIKEKRLGIASRETVTIREVDTKIEDAFDLWTRERAERCVRANRLLKKEAAWSRKRKDGQQTSIDLPEEESPRNNPLVVSARPGTVTFVESGVEFNRSTNEWQPLTEKSQLEPGDKLRTNEHSYLELTVLPDMNLRLDRGSEVSFEELSNESISVKLLRGSMILDVARFDRKQVPLIAVGGVGTSVVIADAGNYRVDTGPSGDQVTVRDGKVLYSERSIGSCRKIFAGTVGDCDKKRTDNFAFWSLHRGEGELFTGRRKLAMASYLLRLRRNRSRNTGFWFQNPGQTHYTFVPFYSPNFRSPYGGKYSTILVPPRVQFIRLGMAERPSPALPRLQLARQLLLHWSFYVKKSETERQKRGIRKPGASVKRSETRRPWFSYSAPLALEVTTLRQSFAPLRQSPFRKTKK